MFDLTYGFMTIYNETSGKKCTQVWEKVLCFEIKKIWQNLYTNFKGLFSKLNDMVWIEITIDFN